MTTSLFKNFIPYLVNSTASASDPEAYESKDPSGATWRSMGLLPALLANSAFIEPLEGLGKLMAVQINERNLPGKVRDEHLKKEVARVEAAEGRKVSKKEYAQLRDEVEMNLLPRAFIRRSVVPVFFFPYKHLVGRNVMLVFTSSQKRADDVVGLLSAVFGERLDPWKIEPEHALHTQMTSMVRDSEIGRFNPGTSALLKGPEKKTVRVKAVDVENARIMALLQDGYEIHEMEMRHGDDESQHSFSVNDGLIFKRVEPFGIKDTGDYYSDAAVRVAHIKDLVRHFFDREDGFGMATPPEPRAQAASANSDEDDEL